MASTALIAGASGLVGGHCLKKLLADDSFEIVKVVGRSPIGVDHHKLVEIIVDFDKLEDFRLQMEATHVFCTLGTTIKKAGSQEAFKRVDFEYPLRLAKIADSLDCPSFSIVTAIGADASSRFFYNKVKGELEKELERLGFDSLMILQPSLLMGDREESRLGEQIAEYFFRFTKPIWIGPLKKISAIEAEQVANAMVKFAKQSPSGVHRYTNDLLIDA